ncbi:MAG: potassium transporter TrkG, partial [Planctomycetota bacterium]
MRPHLPILALVLSPFGIASSTGETVEPVAWLLSALASLALLAASFSSSGFILALIATASVFVTILIRDSVLDHPSETLIVGASWIAWTIAVSDHCKTKVLMLSMGSDYEAGRRSSDRAVGNREFLLTALGATAICGAFLWCEAIENKAIDWSATYGLGVVSIAYLAYLKTLTSLGRLSIILRIGLLVCGTAMVVTAHWFGLAIYASLAGCLVLIISSTIDRWSIFSGAWWSPIVNHPARLLAIPFLFACAIGTGLLLLPVSSTGSKLSILDAAFTSTSAVCVTGLIVKDTPTDFTMLGQIWIILLIQFGGLGMMTISSSVFQLLGRRMGIRQEKLLTSISQRPASVHRQSLFRVLKFTFVVELAGIVILSILFIDNGDRVVDAFWRATFTSISAFCNAGFALQTDSLGPYAGEPLILHTIGILII